MKTKHLHITPKQWQRFPALVEETISKLQSRLPSNSLHREELEHICFSTIVWLLNNYDPREHAVSAFEFCRLQLEKCAYAELTKGE